MGTDSMLEFDDFSDIALSEPLEAPRGTCGSPIRFSGRVWESYCQQLTIAQSIKPTAHVLQRK